MAEQENKETIVFLPWTVEPQPQTQAVILQQPSETHLRLDATTDKTAISSFVIATIIALALAGLATLLAYWYGRKSFDLTKQSFDAVIAQIKSSEQVALDLNQRLFEQQRQLQANQQFYELQKAADNKIRELSLQFILQVESFRDLFVNYFNAYGHISQKKKYYNPQIGIKINQIRDEYLQASKTLIAIELNISDENETIRLTKEILQICREAYIQFLSEPKSNDPHMNIQITNDYQKKLDPKIEDLKFVIRNYLNKKAA